MAETRITVGKNGPLCLEGEFNICDALGNNYGLAGRTFVALCRCGQPGNKPFCDGSHNKVGFQHEPQAFGLPPPKTQT
jgi:CDGSH-type Zn-finger protein